MTIRFQDITSQVDGVTDTFTTSTAYVPGSLSLGYNGQLYPKGVNVAAEIDPHRFKLKFVPAADTHSLLVIYQDYTTEWEDVAASAFPPRTVV